MPHKSLVVACSACTAAAACTAYWLWFSSGSRKHQQDAEEIPEEFKDPITYETMTDPVVLCATGQVYDYQSLRRWLTAGNYRCPRTNLDLLDAHVTRVPWLKYAILDWLKQHGRELPAEPQPALAGIEALRPEIASGIRGIRNESGRERLNATTMLAYKYRQWTDSTAASDAATHMLQAEVRAAVMDDLLWMVRYGEPELQGAAASMLACCKHDEELAWLAATGIVPLVAMVNTGSKYAQEWALQVLYKVCLRVPRCRPLLWRAGCIQALLQLVSKPRSAVGFHRDRAAVVLATLAEAADVKEWLRKHGVVPLTTLLLTTPDRWEQRDAAFALMALQLDSQQLQAAAEEVLARHPALAAIQKQQQHHTQQGSQAATADGADSSNGSSSQAGRTNNPAAAASSSAGASSAAAGHDAAAPDGSSHSSRPSSTAGSAAEHGDAAVAVAGPRDELLQCGLGGVHELLGRYRWCSQRYLDGQADAPDAGLTEQERTARQHYEEALARYRQALAQRQQQADLMHQPEQAQPGAADGQGEEAQPAPQQQQPQPQPQQQQQPAVDAAAVGQQPQMAPNEQVQWQQEMQQQQREGQDDIAAAAAVNAAAGAAAAGAALAQPQGPRRHRPGQQQPRHWMAEHDADGASGHAEDGVPRGLVGGSSSSSSAGSSDESSDEDDDMSQPVRLLGMR